MKRIYKPTNRSSVWQHDQHAMLPLNKCCCWRVVSYLCRQSPISRSATAMAAAALLLLLPLLLPPPPLPQGPAWALVIQCNLRELLQYQRICLDQAEKATPCHLYACWTKNKLRQLSDVHFLGNSRIRMKKVYTSPTLAGPQATSILGIGWVCPITCNSQ